MSKLVLLDSCTLGLITNPNENAHAQQCREWAVDLRRKGAEIKVPEIADYELRRQYIRMDMSVSLAELDNLIKVFGYEEICTEAMRKAAESWGILRRDFGRATAKEHQLDADVILSGQAFVASRREQESGRGYMVVIATDNLRHLRLVWPESYIWEDIVP